MSARILYFPSPVTLATQAERGHLRNLPATSPGQGLPCHCKTDMASMARAVGLGCVRGTTIMLAFEAVAGLGIYTGWHLLRLLY